MNISFIIQGQILHITNDVINKIKEVFPTSEIILSTWNNENYTNLNNQNIDTLIVTEDPGSEGNGHNAKRQLIGVSEGLRRANNSIACRIRSDLFVNSNNIVNYYQPNKFTIGSITTFDPNSSQKRVYNFSDWFVFADKKKLLELFTPNENYQINPNLAPEQNIWLNYISKQTNNISFPKSMNDINDTMINESIQFITSNLIIANSKRDLNLDCPKYSFFKDEGDGNCYITREKWLKYGNSV